MQLSRTAEPAVAGCSHPAMVSAPAVSLRFWSAYLLAGLVILEGGHPLATFQLPPIGQATQTAVKGRPTCGMRLRFILTVTNAVWEPLVSRTAFRGRPACATPARMNPCTNCRWP